MPDNRILLIEDDPAILSAASLVLRTQGFEVDGVMTGAEALAAFARREPDLVLIDIGLPDTTGLELSRRLGISPGGPLPFIFLTANGALKTRLECFGLGARDYIQKPVSLDELIARVRVHLEVRRTQATVVQRGEELRLRERLRQDLTDMIVHDLRMPLSCIKASIDIAQMRGMLRTDVSRLVSDLGSSADMMLMMVNDLLDLSRAREALLKVVRKPVDPVPLIARVQALFINGCAKKDVALQTRVDRELGTVETDPALMFRLAANLVSNAVSFAPPGSAVELDLRRAGSALHLAVLDRGPGVPDSRKSEIFEKFCTTRSGESLTEGAGIGLAFCRLAAKSLGGRIWVEDRPGGGSAFAVEFEVKAAAARTGSR